MGVDMKGLLYTVMASLLIVSIFSIIFFHSQIGEKNIDISIRANELKYFVDSIESDLNRFIEISGKRALIAAVSNITVSGHSAVFEDAGSGLAELIQNGTIKGSEAPLVDTSNINKWEENVSDIASDSGFTLNFESIEIDVTQNDSFNILFDVKILLNLSDEQVKMGVIRNITTTQLVSIEGIEDPIFPLNTFGRVSRIIRYYNFTNYAKDLVEGSIAGLGSVSGNATTSTISPNSEKIFITDNMTQPPATLNSFGGVVSEGTYVPSGLIVPYIGGASGATAIIQKNQRIYLDFDTKKVWDLKNLTDNIFYGYYRSSDKGASFLDRLEGKLTLSSKYEPYGLETVVNLEDIIGMNLGVDYTFSCIDYKYWNNITGNAVRNGDYDPVFDWFKIDSEDNHPNIYGVNELIS